MTGTLRLALLGAPQIWIDEKPVTGFITSKAKALFYYLAVTGRPHARTTLATLLWPDGSEGQARKNLRDVLPNVRRLLDPYLIVTRDQVAFNGESPHWSDVEEFCKVLAAQTTNCHLLDVQNAVALYQGNFLDGFYVRDAPEFEAWVLAQRESLQEYLRQGLYTLVDAHIAQKTYGEGLALTRHLLALEAWDERAHRQQMWLLAANGQRSSALAQYDVCRHRLADALGVEPAVETTQLYERIRAENGEQSGELSLITPTLDPPIAALPQHNLPRMMTPLIGRTADLAHLQSRLLNQAYPFVTLVGEGGIGKTQLALALANEMAFQFTDGVCFVPLVSLSAGESLHTQLAAAIQRALKFTTAGSAPLKHQLFDQLRDKNLLLILDNFEQIRSGGDFILDLRQVARKVKILVTSRQRLNLYGEYVYYLDGLSIPDQAAAAGHLAITSLMQYEGIQLFVERAERTIPGFQLTEQNQAAVVRICRFVEGVPLGIKLAVTLLEQHNCRTIADTLTAGNTRLGADLARLPTRDHRIQAVLVYSWQLLTAAEASILAQCAIFPGSFTAEAAAAVANATPIQLHRLVDRLLLLENALGCFEMHELVRQYAIQQLQSQPAAALQTHRRHALFFIDLLHNWQTNPADVRQNEQSLHQELDQLRTAWGWALVQGEWELLGRGIAGLFTLYRYAGYYHEAANVAIQAVEQLRQHIHDTPEPAAQVEYILAQLLLQQIEILLRLGQTEEVEHCLQEVLQTGERLGLRDVQAEAYWNLSWIEFRHAHSVAATDAAEKSLRLARQESHLRLEANALNALGIFWGYRREHARAISYLQEALVLAQQIHHYALESSILINMGEHDMMFAEYSQALRHFQQARSIALAHQYREDIGVTAYNLANLFQALGDWNKAGHYFEEALTCLNEIGETYFASLVRIYWGRLLCQIGDYTTAISYCTQAQQQCQADDYHDIEPRAWNQLGKILIAQQRFREAEAAYHQVLTLTTQASGQTDHAMAQAGLAQLYLEQHQLGRAKHLVDTLWPLLETLPLCDPYEQPFDLIWSSYRVLIANNDPRASALLRHGWQLLMEQALKIDDETLRRSFLENVRVNRQIGEAMEKTEGRK